MMFCIKCGKELQPNSVFCCYCGVRVDIRQQNSGTTGREVYEEEDKKLRKERVVMQNGEWEKDEKVSLAIKKEENEIRKIKEEIQHILADVEVRLWAGKTVAALAPDEVVNIAEPSEIQYCPYCGSEVNHMNYCGKCGNKLRED